ncbi:MAG: retroviral-like aspartic protease family protein [Azospirillaceae bacterium]|nr:retroviral-like aspartic protease family protein [Azospirillaceae bacterium]
MSMLSLVKRWFTATAAAGVMALIGASGAQADCVFAKSGTMPLSLEGGRLVTSATINGKPVRFLVDTGAFASLVSRPAAARLGLGARDANTLMYGLDGGDRIKQATLASLDLGTWHRQGVAVYVSGQHDFVPANPDIVGVLGMDFLQGYDIEFDLSHKALSLYRPEGCDAVELAYWTKTYSAIALDDSHANWRDAIRLQIAINGRPVAAQLDSGAAVSVLDAAVARASGVHYGQAPTGTTYDHGPVESHVGVFDTLTLGDEAIRNAKLRISDIYGDFSGGWSGSQLKAPLGDVNLLLGADFLRAHHVYVAFSQRKVYFTYEGGPAFSLQKPMRTCDCGQGGGA